MSGGCTAIIPKLRRKQAKYRIIPPPPSPRSPTPERLFPLSLFILTDRQKYKSLAWDMDRRSEGQLSRRPETVATREKNIRQLFFSFLPSWTAEFLERSGMSVCLYVYVCAPAPARCGCGCDCDCDPCPWATRVKCQDQPG